MNPRKTAKAAFLRFAMPLLGAIALLSGCAAPAPVEEVEEVPALVWPAPPEAARIRYVGSLKSIEANDRENRRSMTDLLMGKEPDQEIETLIKPRGLHADKSGRLLVTDSAPNGIVVFNLESGGVERWGLEGESKVDEPLGIDSDSDGNIYVADSGNSRIVVFAPDGRLSHAFGGKDILPRPVGVAVQDTGDRVFVSDSILHKILVFDRNGMLVSEIGNRGNGDGQFNFPTYLELSKEGNLYVADTMNFRVQVFSPDGSFISSYGESGRTIGSFNRLKGMAFDSEQNLYVIDGAFDNFQIFNRDFELLLFVGSAGVEPGQFNLPTDIHIDEDDKIYVADSMNRRIQIFEFLGSKNIEN